MTETDQDPQNAVIIKRYASRKLYDAAAREYVTLEDIAQYIRDGRDVQIIDKKTGEDLTRQYLVQIIADFESQGESALPTNILTDLVRHYHQRANDVTSTMSPAFLGQMFDAFRKRQQQTLSELGELGGNVLNPEKMMGTVNDTVAGAMRQWQARQSEFFDTAMKQWGFGFDPESASQKGNAPPANPTPQNSTQGDGPGDNESAPISSEGQEAKIRAIEEHLKLLQDQLSKLR